MVTFLTDPLPIGRYMISELARKIYSGARRMLNPPRYNYGSYRGHFAVTRSVIEGLKTCGLSHNYNPSAPKDLFDTVVVLSGVRTLRQAIELKRRGYFKKLFAGPNIVVFASDHNSLIASPEVDVVITPSQWVVDLYLADSPSLNHRCLAWPAGVDTNYWTPTLGLVRENILIFEKQNKGPVGPIAPYVEYLNLKGYKVEVIRYGEYTHVDYLEALNRARLMLGFVVDESQGIAWAEAWAANVPTLIWRNELNTYRGRSYRVSTAPYLNASNGLFFDNFEDFKGKFACWEQNADTFTPRAWTLANMSDQVCAINLYRKLTDC
jgi:hypothetical protein